MTPSHSEYFIEKDQLPVDITMINGEALSGLLFVQPSWRKPALEYDAPAILNLGDSYFPLQLGDGSTRLVAKAHVVTLRGSAAEPENGEQAFGVSAVVSIRCVNGESVTGRLTITRVPPSLRVLDFLNRSADEFIAVHVKDVTVLVNCRHIMMVTDESDGAT